MEKNNRAPGQPKQQTSAMSSSHSYTPGVIHRGNDPRCRNCHKRECTCDRKSIQHPHSFKNRHSQSNGARPHPSLGGTRPIPTAPRAFGSARPLPPTQPRANAFLGSSQRPNPPSRPGNAISHRPGSANAGSSVKVRTIPVGSSVTVRSVSSSSMRTPTASRAPTPSGSGSMRAPTPNGSSSSFRAPTPNGSRIATPTHGMRASAPNSRAPTPTQNHPRSNSISNGNFRPPVPAIRPVVPTRIPSSSPIPPYRATSPAPPPPAPPPQQNAGPLKIKLTVPLGMRKALASGNFTPTPTPKPKIPLPSFKKSKPVDSWTNGGASSSAIIIPERVSSDGDRYGGAGSSTSLPYGSPEYSTAPAVYDPNAPKKRGRPPKAVVAAREAARLAAAGADDAYAPPGTSVSQQLKQEAYYAGRDQYEAPSRPFGKNPVTMSSVVAGKLKQKSSKKTPGKKATLYGKKSTGGVGAGKKNGGRPKSNGVMGVAAPQKKRNVVLSDPESSSLSEPDSFGEGDDDDNDDAKSGQFPTFVSASAMSTTSALSSTASTDDDSDVDDDSSSLSGFDTDSSIEAEEENFILNEARGGRRGDGPNKRREHKNNWVIRPRKKSVGLSDVDMDIGSDDEDATEDEEEDEEADEEDGEAAEEDEPEDAGPGVGYAGVATGWSEEDDESGLDADLFFANLSDTSAEDASSSDEDGDLAEVGSVLLAHVDQTVDNRPFDITESWDGQIMFTNGMPDTHNHGLLDMDFEPSAFIEAPSPSKETDVYMTDGGEGEYEEDDDCDLDISDGGDTTEEELVGDDGLPTERAMLLFRSPVKLSPTKPCDNTSPSPADRRPPVPVAQSIKPAFGRTYWNESDEHDEPDNESSNRGKSSSRGRGPTMGRFLVGVARRAIINAATKDAPSPFARVRSRSRRGSLFSQPDLGARGRLPIRHSSPPGSNRTSFQVASSTEEMSHAEPDHRPAEPVDLDDVLDAAFLVSEPAGPEPSSTSSDGGDGRRHLKNLSRWDLISVGAFRQTRESTFNHHNPSGNWSAETPRPSTSDGFTYSTMMRSSPMNTMLWQNKESQLGPSQADADVIMSPIVLPTRDGDRTPTSNIAPHRMATPDPTPHKTRKEAKRDKKMKRNGQGPIHRQHGHHKPNNHHHSHHPNLKSRSTSAVQRTNFFATSSVPVLHL